MFNITRNQDQGERLTPTFTDADVLPEIPNVDEVPVYLSLIEDDGREG